MADTTVDVSANSEGQSMEEPVRWVSKAEAAREMEVSLSTLDRVIRKGEVDVRREGRRVYVRMHGPEYPNDEELLRRAIIREDELERTVQELDRSASELERERGEAREPASAREDAYRELEAAYRREWAAHDRMRRVALNLGLVAAALLATSVLVAWRLLRRGS